MEQEIPKPKNKTGMIIGMVACIVLAIGGVGFGVYGMMQKSNHTSDMKVEIKNADGQITALETDKISISDDKKTITIADTNVETKNPIISAKSPLIYQLSFTSGVFSTGTTSTSVDISVRDGEIIYCQLYSGSYDNRRASKECAVNGLSGKIYKVLEAGEGHDPYDDKIIFILEDGSVDFFPLSDIANSSNLKIKGKAKINGFVTDAIRISVAEKGYAGGGSSTVFILSDGSIARYDETMFK